MGTEKVSIEISIQEDADFKIKKQFVVTEVRLSAKNNDASEVMLIKLIEDVGYLSSLMRVSRSFTSKKIDIIEKLVNLTGRNLAAQKPDTFNLTEDKLTRVIVPNMMPLQAANWIKDGLYTDEGMPFFLYSTISSDTIFLSELNRMLTRNKMAENDFISNAPRALVETIAFIYLAFLSLYVVTTSANGVITLSKIAVIAIACQKVLPQLQQIYASWTRLSGNSKSIEKILKDFECL